MKSRAIGRPVIYFWQFVMLQECSIMENTETVWKPDTIRIVIIITAREMDGSRLYLSGNNYDRFIYYCINLSLSCEGENITYSVNKGCFQIIQLQDKTYPNENV